jgi:NTE family protein
VQPSEPKEDAFDQEPFQEPAEQLRPPERPKLGLILGPGGARTLAHTAVIKELVNNRIPIHAVVGLEWGALVAALYAQNARVHEAEWKLFKLKTRNLLGRSFFSSQFKPKEVDVLSSYIDKNFKLKNTYQFKTFFACPSLSLYSGQVVMQKRGPIAKILRKCLPYPPLLKPTDQWVAAAFAIDEALQYLRGQGVELAVLVDVLASGQPLNRQELLDNPSSAILLSEVRRAMGAVGTKNLEVISVRTGPMPIYGFDKGQSLLKAGRQAGKDAAERFIREYGY